MQQNKSSVEKKFNELKQKMAIAEQIKTNDLSKAQQTVILVHAVNLEAGLQCVFRNGDVIQFPQNWSNAKQGVYKFNYRMKSDKKDSPAKTVQFRIVDNQQSDGSLSVNYSIQDSQQLHQYEIKYQKQKLQQIFKSYQKNLTEKLKQKKNQKVESQYQPIRNLQPQWKALNVNNQRQPPPLFGFPNQGNNNPLYFPQGGQYIGPDNQIFRGRGQGNPDLYPNSNIIDPRRPLGSRFDPLDPFGSQGLDEKPRGGRDFQGFDSFGRPFGGGGFNPGKFI